MNLSPSILFSSTAHVALMAAGQGGGVADVPDWIELLPAGAEVIGRDGRKFKASDRAGLVAATMAYNSGRDIVVDFEHATDVAAPKGQVAPRAVPVFSGSKNRVKLALSLSVRVLLPL
jgi:phage I-like protein